MKGWGAGRVGEHEGLGSRKGWEQEAFDLFSLSNN